MDSLSDGAGGPPIFMGTLKIAAAVAFAASCLCVWLSWSPPGSLQPAVRMAAALRGLDDPVTTGSITKAAASARLDPCGITVRP